MTRRPDCGAPSESRQPKRPKIKARAPADLQRAQAAQTIRNKSPCTGGAPSESRQPKRPKKKPVHRRSAKQAPSPDDQKQPPVHRRSAKQAPAQTTKNKSPCTTGAPSTPPPQRTRNDSPCTAGAPDKPQQPQRPETAQEHPAPTTQALNPLNKNRRFSTKLKINACRTRPKNSKKEIS